MFIENNFLNHYQLIECIGRGGMGAVWKALDTKLDRIVAIKLLTNQEPSFIERFRVEAKVLARLDHPNIVKIYSLEDTRQGIAIVMEYVEGASWREHIDRGKYGTEGEIGILVEKILSALSYAHNQNIIHRDIKPENILITSEGHVKLTDFGIAKITSGDHQLQLTQAGQVPGTLYYMSPEQVRALEIDCRTDLYSLGASIYYALSKFEPFKDTKGSLLHIQTRIVKGQITPLNHTVSAGWKQCVQKAMQVNKEKRFANADMMLQYVGSLSTKEVTTIFEPAIKTFFKKNISQVAASVGLLVFCIGMWLLLSRPTTQTLPKDISKQELAQQSSEVSTTNTPTINQTTTTIPNSPKPSTKSLETKEKPKQISELPQTTPPATEPETKRSTLETRHTMPEPEISSPNVHNVSIRKVGRGEAMLNGKSGAAFAIPPGEALLKCTAGGLGHTRVIRAIADKITEVTCYFETTMEIKVQDVDTRDPVAARITINGVRQQGSYISEPVVAGRYRVIVSADGYKTFSEQVEIAPSANVPLLSRTIRVQLKKAN